MVTTPRVGLGANQEAVRRHNLSTLLRRVHLGGPTSRAELTSSMGLNRSTIGGLVTELTELGLTRTAPAVVGPRQGSGRPSQGVAVSEGGPFVVAVDLGVDRMVVARVGLGGVVHARARVDVRPGGEAWQVAAEIAALVHEVTAQAPAGSPMVGIGVAVPGLVRVSDGLVRLAPNLGWVDVSPGPMILAALGVDVPVSIGNDADLGALAEHHRGVGVAIDDLIYLSGNVGVGAGVVAGGMPLAGAGGYAGEIGHLRLTDTGRPCHCGNHGCWETSVGAHAIAETIGCPPEGVAGLDAVLEDYDVAPEGLGAIGLLVGEGIAGIVNAFNPRMVVLGGYLRFLYRLVPDDVTRALDRITLPAPRESVTLCEPGLGADSVLHGAAELALEPLLADPVGVLRSAHLSGTA